MVEMAVHRVGLCTKDATPVIVLRECRGERFLPVKVSTQQANAAMRHYHRVPPFRPQCHETFVATLTALGAAVKRGYLDPDSEYGLTGRLLIVRDDAQLVLETTGADAVVLALRSGAPITVAEELLVTLAGSDLSASPARPEENRATPPPASLDPFRPFIDSLSSLDDLGQ